VGHCDVAGGVIWGKSVTMPAGGLAESRASESNASKASGSRASESRTSESKASESKTSESRASESESRASGSRASKSKHLTRERPSRYDGLPALAPVLRGMDHYNASHVPHPACLATPCVACMMSVFDSMRTGTHADIMPTHAPSCMSCNDSVTSVACKSQCSTSLSESGLCAASESSCQGLDSCAAYSESMPCSLLFYCHDALPSPSSS
jgi:hypothetical protein